MGSRLMVTDRSAGTMAFKSCNITVFWLVFSRIVSKAPQSTLFTTTKPLGPCEISVCS